MTAQERHDLVKKILRDPDISDEDALRRIKGIFDAAAAALMTAKKRSKGATDMKCEYCQIALRGFADSRVVELHGHKFIACADIDACNARVAAQERARAAGE